MIPSGGYNNDFEPASDPPPPGMNTDEQHRIPLLELQFHDYVASTWNWRNTNFQYLGTSAQKDLFNALYGTMPMWNMTTTLWAAHQQEFLDSYQFQERSRSRVGFDDMVGHGWLSDDRKLQYTDWASGVRIVANFDTSARQTGGMTVPPLDFIVIDSQAAGVDGGVPAMPDLGVAPPPPPSTPSGCAIGGRAGGSHGAAAALFALLALAGSIARRRRW
jgi:hypothetical protein